MSLQVSKEQFQELLQEKLGSYFDRALEIFQNCGRNISWDVTNVIIHAVDKGKVDEVLLLLEKHHREVLVYQHPEIRGRVATIVGNPTELLLLRICKEVLKLQSNPT